MSDITIGSRNLLEHADFAVPPLHIPDGKGGCYKSSDKTTYPIMWNKPKEIAGYEGPGFEIAATATRDGKPHIDPAAALKLWKDSTPHRDVLLSRGIWAKKPWKALGAVYHSGFACAWFGRVDDG